MRVTGGPVGGGDEENLAAEVAELGEHPAEPEHFVVGMRCDHDRAMTGGDELLGVRARQPSQSRPSGPATLGRALATDYAPVHKRASTRSPASTASPSAARSRSAWLWRMNTGRSAAWRANRALRQNGVAPSARPA